MRRFWLWAGVLLLGMMTGRAGAQPGPSMPRFEFKEPRAAAYRIEHPAGKIALLSVPGEEWLRAWPEDGSTNFIQLGRRVVLHLAPGTDVNAVLRGQPLELEQTVAPQLFILRTRDAATAMRAAAELSTLPGVLAAHPERRRRVSRNGAYAPKPNDPYFIYQWHLENRAANGAPMGVDLNVRAAWPITRGAGIVIAQGDDGLDLSHPDLAARVAGAPHYNFVNSTTNGAHAITSFSHGTCVGGLIAADGGNGIGGSGVAPAATLASWVVFDNNDLLVSDIQLMNMFPFASNIVSVENHSWGNAGAQFLPPSQIEIASISNTVTLGRQGRGVVICRAGGNGRADLSDSNDDGYANDPAVIAVAAARSDGRAASYSNPGACVLVAAPSGDAGFPTLFTTDRLGSLGYNQISFTNDLANYVFDGTGFSGTSGATPQIAGVCALILAVNRNLTVRDVQQILVLSARHFDFADADLTTNGAGLRVSHNVGFGIPDAGQAVAIAKRWQNRPARTNVTLVSTTATAIPDDGLRLVVSGQNVPASLTSIACVPGTGPHADAPTAALPLVDVGQALAPLATNLTGKAALIQRGVNFFTDKINYAAQAGANFAVIYNSATGSSLGVMGSTDFVPIPAVFIGYADGTNLQSYIAANPTATARIVLNAAAYNFAVTNTLLCEHVLVRVRTDHPARGDLRITLTSPAGTRSVLQHVNQDNTTLTDWTYMTTHHFFEATAGTWTVAVSDEEASLTGNVLEVDLTVLGVAITDTDNDGLDDNWERANFGSLAQGPKDDPDRDGYSNMREQLMGTNPNAVDAPFQLAADVSFWDERLARVSWPASTNFTYTVTMGTNVGVPFNTLSNFTGRFPELELFTPYTNIANRFFGIRAVPNP